MRKGAASIGDEHRRCKMILTSFSLPFLNKMPLWCHSIG